jgi:probable HAF family extracellular repeat protein
MTSKLRCMLQQKRGSITWTRTLPACFGILLFSALTANILTAQVPTAWKMLPEIYPAETTVVSMEFDESELGEPLSVALEIQHPDGTKEEITLAGINTFGVRPTNQKVVVEFLVFDAIDVRRSVFTTPGTYRLTLKWATRQENFELPVRTLTNSQDQGALAKITNEMILTTLWLSKPSECSSRLDAAWQQILSEFPDSYYAKYARLYFASCKLYAILGGDAEKLKPNFTKPDPTPAINDLAGIAGAQGLLRGKILTDLAMAHLSLGNLAEANRLLEIVQTEFPLNPWTRSLQQLLAQAQDTTHPLVAMLRDSPATVECGGAYKDDTLVTKDGSVVSVTNDVNAAVLGTYTSTYTLTYPDGRVVIAPRIVHVVDTTPAVVELLGDDPLALPCGPVFSDPGATAADACAGDLTSAIRVSGSVDPTVPGTYTLLYTATDPSGNQGIATRKVNVTSPPLTKTLEPPAGGAQAPTYAITDLGTLPGQSYSYGRAINASGQVVGGSGNRAFIWDAATGMQDLGVEPAPAPWGLSPANAVDINDSGLVVGGSGGPFGRAFLWDSTNGARWIGPANAFGYATAINSAGHVLGQFCTDRCRSFLQRNGTVESLPEFPNSFFTFYAALNDAGDLVGSAYVSGVQKPFLYRGGNFTVLPTLLGAFSSSANAINSAGQIVGQANLESGGGRAWLYSGGVLTDLGLLPGSAFAYSYATAINNLDHVVGGSGNRAFLYKDGVMTDINSLLPANAGWQINYAADINDAGQIVGSGFHNGLWRGYLLEPQFAPPTFTCPAAISVQPDAAGHATVPDIISGLTVTGPCLLKNIVTLTQCPVAGTRLGPGDYTIHVTATDACEKTATCSIAFTVTSVAADTTPPRLTCPGPITVACNTERQTPVTFVVTATDTVDPNPLIHCVPASGSGFNVGVTTVNCTARDAGGNSTNCSFSVTRAALGFTGFLAPIGGADATGGNFANPIRTFKLGSRIPVKFTASCDGSAVTTGIHTLQLIKWSNQTTAETPIDASPADAATTGNQFRWATDQWQYVLDTQATAMTKGAWELRATLSDGTTHCAFIALK